MELIRLNETGNSINEKTALFRTVFIVYLNLFSLEILLALLSCKLMKLVKCCPFISSANEAYSRVSKPELNQVFGGKKQAGNRLKEDVTDNC